MSLYLPVIKLWLAWGKHNPATLSFQERSSLAIIHPGVKIYGFGIGEDRFIFGLFRMTQPRITDPNAPKETP